MDATKLVVARPGPAPRGRVPARMREPPPATAGSRLVLRPTPTVGQIWPPCPERLQRDEPFGSYSATAMTAERAGLAWGGAPNRSDVMVVAGNMASRTPRFHSASPRDGNSLTWMPVKINAPPNLCAMAPSRSTRAFSLGFSCSRTGGCTSSLMVSHPCPTRTRAGPAKSRHQGWVTRVRASRIRGARGETGNRSENTVAPRGRRGVNTVR